MTVKSKKKKKAESVDSAFNLTTALVLLVMLLVVVVALLANMLFDERKQIAEIEGEQIYCVPITPAKIVPTATPVPWVPFVPEDSNPTPST